jgi:hypothetical protein
MIRLRVAVGIAFLAGGCWIMGGQSSRSGPPAAMPMPTTPANHPGMPPIGGGNSTDPDLLNNRLEEQQMRSRNNERQKRMVAETDKLVELTKQLKEQVESPDKPLQPSEVGKKAEEIEKLAKSVKDRMKG